MTAYFKKRSMNMFTATKLQAVTYLLGVCLFSVRTLGYYSNMKVARRCWSNFKTKLLIPGSSQIAFLVFLNSSVSFVITDLIGQRKGVGDAVGTLGFADEIVAILACPAWGVISDRLGVRLVSYSSCLAFEHD